MKILVLGSFNRDNLMSEMYKDSLMLLLLNHEFHFIHIEDTENLNISQYDTVLYVGGEITQRILRLLSDLTLDFTRTIIAVSVIADLEVINKPLFDIFDHIFFSDKSTLLEAQRRIGSKHAHFLPDIIFKSTFEKQELPQNSEKSIVGIFFSQACVMKDCTIFSFAKFLESISEEYKIILFSFDTSSDQNNSDLHLNTILFSMLEGLDVILDDELDACNLFEKISNCDFVICQHYSVHIACIIAGIPFLSICSTLNVERLLSTIYYEYRCDVVNHKLMSNARKKFNTLLLRRNEIRAELTKISDHYDFLLDTMQLEKLLKDKRTILPDILAVDINAIKRECDILISQKNTSTLSLAMTPALATKISQYICLKVTGMPSSKYVRKISSRILKEPEELLEIIHRLKLEYRRQFLDHCPKICIDYFCQDELRDVHRSGWQFVNEHIRALSTPVGVLFDTYLDRTFLWSREILEITGHIPYTVPWMGFLHHTENNEYTPFNAKTIFECSLFRKSLPTCLGIFVLSERLRKFVLESLKILNLEIPVITVKHPTATPKIQFTMQNYDSNNNKMLVNIGAWYRNPFTIYEVKTDLQKASLKGIQMDSYFPPKKLILTPRDLIQESEQKTSWEYYMLKYLRTLKYKVEENTDIYEDDTELCRHLRSLISSVNVIEFLSNEKYDILLSENIVFLHLIDCSAANTIVECIVRNTPIVINRIPAVEEYLGKDYPLFWNNKSEISITREKIISAFTYLQRLDKSELCIETFIEKMKFESQRRVYYL